MSDIDTEFHGTVPTTIKTNNTVSTENNNLSAWKKGWAKTNAFMNKEGVKTGLDLAGTVSSALPSLVQPKNSLDQGITQGREAVAGALMKSGNPWAMAAGATVMAFSKTGGFTNASKGVSTGADIMNGIAAFALPGAGYFVPKTRDIEKDARVMASSGYGNVVDNVNTASNNANAKLLFGRGKANSMISEAAALLNKTSNVLQKAEMRNMAAANPLYATATLNLNISGNITPNTFMAAKKGAKLYNTDFAKRVLSYKNGKLIIKAENGLRTIELLISDAKEQNPRFIQRLNEKPRGIWFKPENEHVVGSHYLGNNGNYVFPQIYEIEDGNLTFEPDWKKALDIAINNNNVLKFNTPEEALLFAENYKLGWPEFFLTIEMKDRFIDPSVIDTYESWLENLGYEPDHTKYDYKTAYENLEPHILLNHLINPEKHHLGSVTLLPDGRYTFLKLGREDLTDPNNTVIKELDFYNAPENEEFRNNYNLIFSEEDNRYYYIPKNNVDFFKKGGSFNVIPEGALHKNKHHLSDVDEKYTKITSKGIPVITESEGGVITLHAEVEKEEWTIRLEVTELIEDYLEEYNKSEKLSHKNLLAFAAGELIVEELLYNTKDNSGLIDKIE